MNPAELFTRCGQSLCGPGPKWKEQFAGMLMMQTNTVDNMSKGTSRIPPGVWMEIGRFLQDRLENSGALIQAISAITGTGMAGHSAYQLAMLNNQPRRDEFQTSVRSGPRPTPARYLVGPAVAGVAFAPDLFAIMNQRISELDVGHDFKTLKIIPGDNGEAIIEAPRELGEATLHAVLAWLRQVESQTGYSIDPFRTTNAQGSFQTHVGEPHPGPRRLG